MIDFHSHILPGMDDGANDIEESLAMLAFLKEQGVTTVIATPHYRCDCSVGSFIKKRQASFDKLEAAMNASGREYPRVLLGAEVAVSEHLTKHKNLERLCIEGTNCILVEMPNRFWEPFLYQVLFNIMGQYRLRLIIAHVDRYFTSLGSNKKMLKLVEMQPVFQISTPALMYRKGKKLLKWMCRFGSEFVFGTDCHNMENRRPFWSQPLKYVIKKYGDEFLNELDNFGNDLLNK